MVSRVQGVSYRELPMVIRSTFFLMGFSDICDHAQSTVYGLRDVVGRVFSASRVEDEGSRLLQCRLSM